MYMSIVQPKKVKQINKIQFRVCHDSNNNHNLSNKEAYK